MTEYQTHAALAQSLEAEVTRLRAVNAELKGIIEAGIKPNNSLEQAAERETLWREIHDAVVKDSDKAYELLRWAETEMRYAGWAERLADNAGRADVYEAIADFLK